MKKEMTNKLDVSEVETGQEMNKQPVTDYREVSVQCHRYQDPAPGMDPQVSLELLDGCGNKKAIGYVTPLPFMELQLWKRISAVM